MTIRISLDKPVGFCHERRRRRCRAHDGKPAGSTAVGRHRLVVTASAEHYRNLHAGDWDTPCSGHALTAQRISVTDRPVTHTRLALVPKDVRPMGHCSRLQEPRSSAIPAAQSTLSGDRAEALDNEPNHHPAGMHEVASPLQHTHVYLMSGAKPHCSLKALSCPARIWHWPRTALHQIHLTRCDF
jgi:hypothetical protein